MGSEKKLAIKTVTVHQLEIDNKAITKAKLAALPIIEMDVALDGLVDAEYEFVARYPLHIFVKIAREQAKTLNILPLVPHDDLIRDYENSPNILTGIILYHEESQSLINSCYVDFHDTDRLTFATNQAELFREALKSVQSIDNFDAAKVAKAIRSIDDNVLLPELWLYHRLSKTLPDQNPLVSTLRRRKGNERLTWQESEDKFKELWLIIQQARAEPRELNAIRELGERWQSASLNNRWNLEWLEDKLEKPFGYNDWDKTKSWLESLLSIAHRKYSEKALLFDERQRRVSIEHRHTPMVFI